MKKYICVHGHFYQPPRENPWTGVIEKQPSAAPSHDWNERVAKECYIPNAKTEILDSWKVTVKTVNNYAQISFNFGPTLLSWLEKAYPQTYKLILEADQISTERFSGHGSAIAQAYNHMIMPLANDRDKRTQVMWGIKDFQFRFKRNPEGMWLPETAVDVQTLEILAEQGVVYTILAPHQAESVTQIGVDEWEDVSDGSIDTQLTYLCRLPSGKAMNIFFYNGYIANEVAFGNMLNDGADFAKRLVKQYPKPLGRVRVSHIANDGETYGHHHKFGNMALAFMLYHVEKMRLAKITVYGEFLSKNPPEFEVKIKENTSWSCCHGVERWRANCGCRLGLHKEWNQEWRKPLRESLDWLRDQLTPFYERSMAEYYDDPWQVRNDYINALLSPSEETLTKYVWSKALRQLSADDKRKIKNLLEIQHYAMLMFTSCGWFFDDISGLESIQILQYAARAMQLAKKAGAGNLEEEFLNRLESAKSNVPEMKNGRAIYNQFVTPARDVKEKKKNV
ncbi:MAG: DUF3536 domain-containing protein [Candidatus Omnitrophica bacterium]|nr:DUF3536 domain-containing protein [Candidatus Omnitrophota bacterium]